jgi:hypothetical protein
MERFIDVRTATITAGAIGLVLGLCLFAILRTRKTYPGFRLTVAGLLCYGAGRLMQSLQGVLPDGVSVLAANLAHVLFWVLCAWGLHAFAGRRPDHRLLWAPFALLAGALAWFTWGDPQVVGRIIAVSLAQAFYAQFCGVALYRHVRPLLREANALLLGILAFRVLWYLARVLVTLVAEPGDGYFVTASSYQGASLLVDIGTLLVVVIGIVGLNAHRLELELVAAGQEIRTLRGILPICAWCKKIRDDQGAWSQLERYLSEHTDAEFSHGICPDCLAKMRAERAAEKS